MNRNFAKPREDMTPEFAPDVLEINGRKVYGPKAVHCLIAGYLPLSPSWPVDLATINCERVGAVFNRALVEFAEIPVHYCTSSTCSPLTTNTPRAVSEK